MFPLSVSYTGMIALDSLTFLKEISHDVQRPSFFCDAVDVVQFSLIRGLYAALSSSLARLNLNDANAVSGVKRSLEDEIEEMCNEEEKENKQKEGNQNHQNEMHQNEEGK